MYQTILVSAIWKKMYSRYLQSSRVALGKPAYICTCSEVIIFDTEEFQTLIFLSKVYMY